jgi:hypothetical protein
MAKTKINYFAARSAGRFMELLGKLGMVKNYEWLSITALKRVAGRAEDEY